MWANPSWDPVQVIAVEWNLDPGIGEPHVVVSTTPPTDLHTVRTALEEGGVTVESSELTMVPTSTIPLDTDEAAKKVLRLIDALDDNDDVQGVFANFDIPDSILEEIDA